MNSDAAHPYYILDGLLPRGFFACCSGLRTCGRVDGFTLQHEPNPEAQRSFVTGADVADLYSWMGEVHERMTGAQAFWHRE